MGVCQQVAAGCRHLRPVAASCRLNPESRIQNPEVYGGGDPPRTPRFVPPTVEEVRAYCQERHNSVDPERFVDFYTTKGWMVGKNRMKDWRAAVRTWEKPEGGAKNGTPGPNAGKSANERWGVKTRPLD